MRPQYVLALYGDLVDGARLWHLICQDVSVEKQPNEIAIHHGAVRKCSATLGLARQTALCFDLGVGIVGAFRMTSFDLN